MAPIGFRTRQATAGNDKQSHLALPGCAASNHNRLHMRIDTPGDPNSDNTSFAGLLPPALRRPEMLARLVMNVSGLGEAERLVARARVHARSGEMVPAILREARMPWRITNANELVVPKTGPVILIANHAFGVADGCVLHTIARMHRADARTVVTNALRYIPELIDEFLFVDPIVGRERENAGPVRRIMRHLMDGNTVAMFPAGAMMRWMRKERRITDPQWTRHLGAMVHASRATVVPMFFHGRNRLAFNLLNAISTDIGLGFMLSEFLARRGREIVLTAGAPIEYAQMAAMSIDETVAHLRSRVFAIQSSARID